MEREFIVWEKSFLKLIQVDEEVKKMKPRYFSGATNQTNFNERSYRNVDPCPIGNALQIIFQE